MENQFAFRVPVDAIVAEPFAVHVAARLFGDGGDLLDLLVGLVMEDAEVRRLGDQPALFVAAQMANGCLGRHGKADPTPACGVFWRCSISPEERQRASIAQTQRPSFIAALDACCCKFGQARSVLRLGVVQLLDRPGSNTQYAQRSRLSRSRCYPDRRRCLYTARPLR